MKTLVFSFLVDFSYPISVEQSIPLMKSIRSNGGELKDSDILLCHVGKMPNEYKLVVDSIGGVLTKEVDQFHVNHKHSNKLRIVEQPEIYNYNYLCLLDCDTYMLDDISDILTKDTLRMKMADMKGIPSTTMQRVFQENKVVYPEENYKCTVSGDSSVIYCNNGFMVCDTSNKEFFDIWVEKTKWICNNQHILLDKAFFSEQVSLTLAIYISNIKFKEVPMTYNYPTHLGVPLYLDIKLIHYHHQMRNGVICTPYPQINRLIVN